MERDSLRHRHRQLGQCRGRRARVDRRRRHDCADPHAVDLDRFAPFGDRVDLDALAGLPQAPAGTVRVGLLGTFARWKGHETFLRALAQLPQELPFRAYVIGDSLYQTEGSQYSADDLRQSVSALGLSGRVGFTGFIRRPEKRCGRSTSSCTRARP